MSLVPSTSYLSGFTEPLRTQLLKEYAGIITAFREGKWKAAELDGGRFCEVSLAVLSANTSGNWPSNIPGKPNNFKQACLDLENLPSARHPRSVRITIPRCLIWLYEVRNNRNVGHVGGEVDANEMDAAAVVACAKWVMAEFVRLFHSVTVDDAQKMVDAIVERTTPLVWEVAGIRKVLDPRLTAKEKVLAVLYSCHPDKMQEKDLILSTKYNNSTNFRKRILSVADDEGLIHYDTKNRVVYLSPKGIEYVEKRLLIV